MFVVWIFWFSAVRFLLVGAVCAICSGFLVGFVYVVAYGSAVAWLVACFLVFGDLYCVVLACLVISLLLRCSWFEFGGFGILRLLVFCRCIVGVMLLLVLLCVLNCVC